MNTERKVIAFHLAELEKVHLAEAKYALNQHKMQPKIVRGFALNVSWIDKE